VVVDDVFTVSHRMGLKPFLQNERKEELVLPSNALHGGAGWGGGMLKD